MILLLLVENRKPAVDQVCRAGNIVAVARCQEDRKTGNVGGLPKPAQGDLADQRLEFDRIIQMLGKPDTANEKYLVFQRLLSLRKRARLPRAYSDSV